jgi:hypothetical protein
VFWNTLRVECSSATDVFWNTLRVECSSATDVFWNTLRVKCSSATDVFWNTLRVECSFWYWCVLKHTTCRMFILLLMCSETHYVSNVLLLLMCSETHYVPNVHSATDVFWNTLRAECSFCYCYETHYVSNVHSATVMKHVVCCVRSHKRVQI